MSQTSTASLNRPRRAHLATWLGRMLRPAPLPVDWTRICAATLAIAGPQAAGLAFGHHDALVLVSTGALCASFSDLTTSYRHRLQRIGLTTVLGAAGFAAGAATATPWQTTAVVVAVSVLSVVCSRMGDLWAASGAQMLTFCIVATGHGSAQIPLGEEVLYFACGELLLLALAAATWPFRRTAPARAAVARVFEAAVRMFDAEGTDARQELTKALNDAQDILATGGSVARSRVYDRLHVVLSHATPAVEASVALAHAGVRPPEATLDHMRTIAGCVRSGALAPARTATESDARGDDRVRALDHALAELVQHWRDARLWSPEMLQQRLGVRERFRLWRANTAFGRSGWHAALRMAVCLALAEGATLALGLDQPYWVAMTVALTLKPNSGSVFARVVLRAVGTVLGVLLAAAVLALVPAGWPTLPFLLVLAAFLPEALSRHYGLFTVVVTSMVLLQLSQSHVFPEQVPAVRLVDSLLGCAIVLVVGHLLWPVERGPALPAQLAAAVESVSEYVQLSLAESARERSPLRRRTYRQLSDLRTALQQQLLEPGTNRVAEQWWSSVIALERVVDAATERAVLLHQDGAETLQDTQRTVSAMRTTARRLRTSADVTPQELRRRLDDVYTQVTG